MQKSYVDLLRSLSFFFMQWINQSIKFEARAIINVQVNPSQGEAAG